jgi:glutamate-1-semialdehyde 2,1-aminomutase
LDTQQPPMRRSHGFTRSAALLDRSRQSLAGGVSSQFRAMTAPHPMFYSHAKGSRIWDVDGNELLDFTLSQGPCILGHSHPELLDRVTAALQRGQLFAGQHMEEMELSEALCRILPCAELVRLSLSGSEASHALLRLARHVTGRPKYLKFVGHYHGWFDNVSFSVSPPRAQTNEPPRPVPWGGGIPAALAEEVMVLPWNDLAAVEATLASNAHEIAAIITEPVMCNQGCIEPAPGFLEGLRSLCDRYGIILIFDEIITGFRLGLGGAQGHYGVTPDLALFGKAMGAGFPISALTGKRAFMEAFSRAEVYHAGTLNGNNVSVAASLAVIDILGRDDAAGYRHIWRLSTRLRDGLAALSDIRPDLRVQGPGPMFHVGFSPRVRATTYDHVLDYDKDSYRRFCLGMLSRGVRLIERGLWYVSLAHEDADIDYALAAAQETLQEMPQ